MSLIDNVKLYAARNWPTFPCNGKIPLIKAWPEAATTDGEQLTTWWHEWPEANIGIVTGSRSGLLILDVDGPMGNASLACLMETHGKLPETLIAKTGKGFHLYLRYPADAVIKNDVARKLGTGLDVRGAGGYVIAPGSRHTNGSAYEWIDPNVTIANPPDWLIQLLTQEPEQAPFVAPTTPLHESKASRYAMAALENACDLVAKAINGTRNDTLNGQAYGIGQLIGANALAYRDAEAQLMEAASSAGLPRREAQATIRSGLNAGMQEPRNLNQIEASRPSSIPTEKTEPKRKALTEAPAMAIQAFSAAELIGKEFAAPRWAIPNLLPEGLTVLAGRPKTGKSWLAFDIALAVARGGQALGNRPVNPGEALYLALEDHERRLQDRLLQLIQDGEAPDTLFFSCEAPRFDKGLIPALQEWLHHHSACRLIVIDTLARIRPPGMRSGDAYQEDTFILGQLQALAMAHRVAVVMLHHTRKATSDSSDPLDEVLGSSAITGTADAILVLRRPRTESVATLFVTGREVMEEALAIEFDADSCAWSLQVESKSQACSAERQKILDCLAMAHTPMGPKQIAESTGLSYDSTRHMIRDMEADGSVLRKARGQYISKTSLESGTRGSP